MNYHLGGKCCCQLVYKVSEPTNGCNKNESNLFTTRNINLKGCQEN